MQTLGTWGASGDGNLGPPFEQQFGVGFVAQQVRLCSAKAAFCVYANEPRDGSLGSSMCPLAIYSVGLVVLAALWCLPYMVDAIA